MESTSSLDMSDLDSVLLWISQKGPDSLFDEETGKLDTEYRDPVTGMELPELVDEYMMKYKDIMDDSETTIYRMVMLDSMRVST